MRFKNFTNPILETDCVGDSLQVINDNFFSLDKNLSEIPNIRPSNSIEIFEVPYFQRKQTIELHTRNSFSYETEFSSVNGVVAEQYTLADGSTERVTRFPYIGVPNSPKPYGTFTLTAPENNPPRVTLYWTAEGGNSTTVYATNSSVSDQSKGDTYFNDTVTSLHVVNDTLYVGGKFTQAGGVTNNKFAVIDLGDNAGNPTVNVGLGYTGTLQPNPLSSSDGDLNVFGEVNTITHTTITSGTNSFNALIIGGSFRSFSKGRGLVILNLDETDFRYNTFPFYVNGAVHSLEVIGDYLYVGGDFDYISQGPYDPTLASGRRVYTKGLAKIELAEITNPYCIDQDFAEAVIQTFEGPAIIHAITKCFWLSPTVTTQIVLGGEFACFDYNGNLVAKNLVGIDENGYKLPYWNPALDGPVYTLKTSDLRDSVGSNLFLYVGGMFRKYLHADGTLREPSRLGNAVCFKMGIPTPTLSSTPITMADDWRPHFNGPVKSMTLDDEFFLSYGYGYGYSYGYTATPAGHVYCYGDFNLINDVDVTYLGAVTKASDPSSKGVPSKKWRPRLQNGPGSFNTSLCRYLNSIIVGGNFERINSKVRHKLARISGVEEEISLQPSLSSIGWELGTQLIGSGMSLSFDTTVSVVTAETYAEELGVITTTTFPLTEDQIHNFKEGQLCRFYIKRLGKTNERDDDVRTPAYLLGWTVNFNHL